MPVCAFDGCPEHVSGGYCQTHGGNVHRSPSSRVTGTHRWRKLKARLLAQPAYRWCAYCGPRATTLDHRIPVADGGPKYDEDNLVPSCQPCNARKGGR